MSVERARNQAGEDRKQIAWAVKQAHHLAPKCKTEKDEAQLFRALLAATKDHLMGQV